MSLGAGLKAQSGEWRHLVQYITVKHSRGVSNNVLNDFAGKLLSIGFARYFNTMTKVSTV